MAWNLAALIRQARCQLPIVLLADEDSAATIRHKERMFDRVIILEKQDRIPFYAKTRLDHYTPFERTLYLDCDAFPFKDITPLLESPSGWPVLLQNFGAGRIRDHRYHWYPPGKLGAYYGLPADRQFVETNSSFILWDSSEKARDFFTLAEHFYASEFVEEYNHTIGHYPDELAFNAALMTMDLRLPEFRPILFHALGDGPISWPKAEEHYYLFGMYGPHGTTHPHGWREYQRRITENIKALTGQYGFMAKASDKVSNGAYSKPRWRGLRKRERPREIDDAFNKYISVHAGQNV